jgi:hypothetical protein
MSMLGFFVSPFNDELLYSIEARYHWWTRGTSVEGTRLRLFGTRRHTTSVDLPRGLDALARNLPPGSVITSDRLLYKHTLYPITCPSCLLQRRAFSPLR